MDLLTDCHSWWKLDDDAPDTIVLNEINTDYNGTLNGSTTEGVSLTGKLGKAFYLDADDHEYVQANDVNCCQVGSGDFTAAIWLRDSNPRTGQKPFSKRDGVNGYGFELTRVGSGNYLRFMVKNTNGDFGAVNGDPLVSGIYVFDGSWHLVIVQRSGDNLYMWADNVLYGPPGSISGSLASADKLVMGARPYFFDYWWNGYLDQMMFWLRALSASERKWLWNNGNGQPNLVSIPRPLANGSLSGGRKGMVA